MKKKMLFLLAACMLIVFTGCSGSGSSGNRNNTFGEETNGLYLMSDLQVKDCMKYDFDTKKYDAKEYEGFLKEELEAYNKDHVYQDEDEKTYEAITIEKCSADKNVLTQILKYYDIADYLNYNKTELQKRSGKTAAAGTLDEAAAAVQELKYKNPAGEDVDIQTLINDKKAESYRYLTTDLQAVLYGDGEIIAYSTNASYTQDLNCVTAKGGENVAVIFK